MHRFLRNPGDKVRQATNVLGGILKMTEHLINQQDDIMDDIDILSVEEEDEIKVKKIIKEWGIDEDLAQDIVRNFQEDELDMNMIINVDGVIESFSNEKLLKEHILDVLEDNGFDEFEYIFVDGKQVDMQIDISFEDHIPEIDIDDFDTP